MINHAAVRWDMFDRVVGVSKNEATTAGRAGNGLSASDDDTTDSDADSQGHSSTNNRAARRRRATHRRLLEAARDLVAAGGPDGFTVGELADAADVGVGTVYNHFQDWRRDPITEWVMGPDELYEVIDIDGSSPIATMCQITGYVVRTAQENPTTAQMMQRLFPTEMWPREAFIQMYADLISSGIDSGEIPATDIETLARAVLSLAQGFIRQVAAGKTLSVDTANQLVLRVLGVSEIKLPD